MTILNFPAAHAKHVPPSGPEYPRLQRQAETTVCPAVNVAEFAGQVAHELSATAPVDAEYLPATQSAHTAEPVAALNFPAKQAVHGPPSGPENPRLQRQAVAAVCANSRCPEFDGQV